MTQKAKQLHPAERIYRGSMTRPEKWAGFTPLAGDVIVCTPAKCGTTWTQTMVAMLLYQTPQLPDRVSALSPWVDSVLSDADDIDRLLSSPSGRRVLKTHTPADGFPVWDGVHVIAVYRHPLDVFLSIRKHVINMKDADNPELCGPIPQAVQYYTGGVFDDENVDRDCLASVVEHHRRTRSRAGSRTRGRGRAPRRLARPVRRPRRDPVLHGPGPRG